MEVVFFMVCPKCGAQMVIDEWGGWKWICFNCDHVDRQATDEECETQRKEIEAYLNKQKGKR